MQLIIASNNAHKIAEMQQILSPWYPQIQGLRQAGYDIHVVEDGLSFAENALKKAQQVSRQTGCAALADDSGLCVDQLSGAPGIYSARFAGENADDASNNRLLLEKLRPLPHPWTGRFECAIALVRPGCAPIQVQAAIEGEILDAPRGENGFGYDPLFVPTGYAQSFAELDAAVKNRISHRAKALALLLQALEAEKQ